MIDLNQKVLRGIKNSFEDVYLDVKNLLDFTYLIIEIHNYHYTIAGGCILLHFGLTLVIAISKYQWDKKLKNLQVSVAPQKLCQGDNTDFGGLLTTGVIFVILAVALHFTNR